MFQFAWYPILHYRKSCDLPSYRTIPCGMGCPIRKPPDRWIMTPPRRLSRSYTSFLGTSTLGIHYQLCSVAENKGSNGYVGPVSFNWRNKNVKGSAVWRIELPLTMQLLKKLNLLSERI